MYPTKFEVVVFHNGSNYDYHFTIKELAKKIEGQFKCLGENTGKYKNHFSYNRKEIKKLIKMGMKILYQYLAK